MVNYLKWLKDFEKNQKLYIKETKFDTYDSLPYVSTYLYNHNIMSHENDDDYEYPGWMLSRKSYEDKDPSKPIQNVCFHDWKKYVGFTEVYFFCEKCDEKTPKEPNWWKS